MGVSRGVEATGCLTHTANEATLALAALQAVRCVCGRDVDAVYIVRAREHLCAADSSSMCVRCLLNGSFNGSSQFHGLSAYTWRGGCTDCCVATGLPSRRTYK